MDTTTTASYSESNNPLNLYANGTRMIQQQTQTHFQQQYPILNQGQFYGPSSHSNHHPSDIGWDKQQQKPSHFDSNQEFSSMPQHVRNQYYPYYPATTIENSSRNIKTEDESPLFVGSAAEHSKMTTNNKYRNNPFSKNDDFLSLIKQDAIKPAIAVDEANYFDEDEEDDEDDEDDNHAKKRSTNTKRNVVEKKRHRRESHNAVERRRRNNINDNIRNLGLLLPENMCQGKLNKGTILRGSVMYIHMLNSQLSKYKERLEHLKYEAATLDPSLLSQPQP